MADTFTRYEHIGFSRYFMEQSGIHFDAGRVLEGSELLWGAAAHALIAVAMEQDWPYNSHGALKNITLNLLNVPGLPEWHSEFNTAEQFHTHFYHGQLTDRQIATGRPKVRRFINRLLERLANNPG